MKLSISIGLFLLSISAFRDALGDPPRIDTSRGDAMIAEYFRRETLRLSDHCLADVHSLEDWETKRGEYRRQLLEMLGLDPFPKRTPLQSKITAKTEHEDFVVEQLHFQSRPGLYVTGNLYLPKELDEPAPAVLYVCGHGRVKENGVSYGNKVNYQHHGAWFARNGYVCLTIDTLQLGEIEGIHHGTYRYNMWWWLNRGYTPAGVEAWNCVRALDYLETRPEVDASRFGVTGRSGGGAYSWWIAAIDDRIKAAVPVAGITDLQNHVVDGCVEGHCDCMYVLNTYRWDYPLVAALVAPRPLLISNTDSDRIFPLDGVVRTFEKVRRIYGMYDAADKCALNITAGPHKDTQELRVHAFRWLNHHLKDDDSPVDKIAEKFFVPEQLKVFDELPDDQLNTEIHESFVTATKIPESVADIGHWEQLRQSWRQDLLEKSFSAWPQNEEPLSAKKVFSADRKGIRFSAFDFTSQDPIRLRLFVVHRAGLEIPELTVLNVLDETSWPEFLATMRSTFESELHEETLLAADETAAKELDDMLRSKPWAMAYVAPRGIGPTAWDQSKRKQTQHRRRFYLLGQSLDGMRVYDVRRAARALRTLDRFENVPLWMQSHRVMAGITLYASLFEPEIDRLDLYELPMSHRSGPIFLNVKRSLDVPVAVAMAAERSRVVLYDGHRAGNWDFPRRVAKTLAWDDQRVQLRETP